MTGKVSESLQGTSQVLTDGFGWQQGLMLPVLPRLCVGRRSQIPSGAVVSTARPEHLPLGAHSTLVHTFQCWSGPSLELHRSRAALASQGLSGTVHTSPGQIYGCSTLAKFWEHPCCREGGGCGSPGSLLCPVCPRASGLYLHLSGASLCPHRTPWSSMESLRKLVSSWEHTGSNSLTWLGVAPGSAPWEGQQLPPVTT